MEGVRVIGPLFWAASSHGLLSVPGFCWLHLPPGCCTPWLCLRRVTRICLEGKGAPHSSGPAPDGPWLGVSGYVSGGRKTLPASPARGGNSSAPGRCGDGSRVGVCSLEPVSGSRILSRKGIYPRIDGEDPEVWILSWPSGF